LALLLFSKFFVRPLREIFTNTVVKQQLKMAEKSLFVTKDKWELFVSSNLILTTATLDYDNLPEALRYPLSPSNFFPNLGYFQIVRFISGS
jgi:hypothetical protein